MILVLDLRNVTNELCSVIDKWFRIGIQLGVDQAKLKEIEMNYQTADRCFSEVISFWLNGNTAVAVNWKSLVEVLEQPFVGEKGLAGRLREKGEMIISETAGVPGPGANESGTGVQPREINGGQRGMKRSVEEKLDDSGDQHHEHQGACTSNIECVSIPCYCSKFSNDYVNNVYIDPEAKKARLATGSGCVAEDKVEEVPGRF